MLSLVAVVCGVFYMIPIPRLSFMAYRVGMANVLVLHAVNVYNNFPLKIATLTDANFKRCMEAQSAMLCGFMLLTPPMPFALMPFLCVSLVNVCHAYGATISKLPKPIGTYVGSRALYLTTPEGEMQAFAMGAVSEVIIAVMTPLLCLVQGSRAAILGFFYFQYVVRRHRSNPLTVQSLELLVKQLDGVFQHRWSPAPLQTIYRRGKSGVAWAAQKLVQ